MKLKLTWALLWVALFTVIPLRVYQYLWQIDQGTGFYKDPVQGYIFLGAVVLFLVLLFICSCSFHYGEETVKPKRNIFMGILSIGMGLILSLIHISRAQDRHSIIYTANDAQEPCDALGTTTGSDLFLGKFRQGKEAAAGGDLRDHDADEDEQYKQRCTAGPTLHHIFRDDGWQEGPTIHNNRSGEDA